MSRKKLVLLIALGLAAAALVVFYLSLPRLVHDAIVSQAQKSGLQNLRLRLVRVKLSSLELADVSAGPAASPSLLVRRAAVSFTPLGLLRKRIRAVSLEGVTVRLEQEGRRLRFPGFSGTGGGGALPVLGRLDLKDGKIRLRMQERELFIPFTAHGNAVASGYVLHAGLGPLGIRIRLLARFDNQFSSGFIEFSAPAAELGSLAELAGQAGAAAGRVTLSGKIVIRGGRLDRADARADGSGTLTLDVPGQGGLELDSLRLAMAMDGAFVPFDIVASARGRRLRFGKIEVDSLFDLDIRGRRWPELEFSLRGLRLARPLPLLVERVAGKSSGSLATMKIDGDLRLVAAGGTWAAAGLPWRSRQPYAVEGTFQAARMDGKLTWALKAAGDGGVLLASGRERLGGRLRLDASLEGDEDRGRAVVNARMTGADARLARGRARAAALSGHAGLRRGPDGTLHARGALRIRGGAFQAAESGGLKAEGIEASLPWVYPLTGRGGRGNFAVARLHGAAAGARNVGGVLAQEGASLSFSGEAHSGLPGLALSFKGKFSPLAHGMPWQAELTVPTTTIAAGTTLQDLAPGLREMTAGGRFAAAASLRGGRSGAAGSASLRVTEGSFDHSGLGLALNGVESAIRLEDAFAPRSAPGQSLRFKELRWQGSLLSEGAVVFGVDRRGLAISAAGFLWSGGRISVDPLRLEPGVADIRATLRCLDVDLARLINALAGSEVVSGEARVSGVVPLKIVNGSPLFLDGLLESAPGVSGRLRVARPELISGGQALVEEAIRDFNYRWIKVRLDSRDGRLNMVVSIDGAPAGKLPLRYDQRKKELVRDPSGKRRVELKGLQLDIRFNDIDLKDLLETGGKMRADPR